MKPKIIGDLDNTILWTMLNIQLENYTVVLKKSFKPQKVIIWLDIKIK
jgi:hypothetical protein